VSDKCSKHYNLVSLYKKENPISIKEPYNYPLQLQLTWKPTPYQECGTIKHSPFFTFKLSGKAIYPKWLTFKRNDKSVNRITVAIKPPIRVDSRRRSDHIYDEGLEIRLILLMMRMMGSP